MEITNEIESNPNLLVLGIYEEKENELSLKYKEHIDEFLIFWPSFESIDSRFYRTKSELLPKMPGSIDEIVVPDEYTKTMLGEKFLISPIRNINQFIAYVSRIGIEALAGSKVWNCDGTFHCASKLFYQNNIILF